MPKKDLVVLVADQNMKFSVLGLLSRHLSMKFRELSVDIYVHPESDPGCFRRGHDFLRPFHQRYTHALLMFDREGCGKETLSAQFLEHDLQERLSRAGWEDRAAAIAIDPELEIWVWSDSPEVDKVLGWAGRQPSLAVWLRAEGYQAANEVKPNRPKEAVEKALRIVHKRRSSVIYRQLAECVGLTRCADPAFTKFKSTLACWFGQDDAAI